MKALKNRFKSEKRIKGQQAAASTAASAAESPAAVKERKALVESIVTAGAPASQSPPPPPPAAEAAAASTQNKDERENGGGGGNVDDDETIQQSGNSSSPGKKKKSASTTGSTSSSGSSGKKKTVEERLQHYKEQVAQEKAGKRKLFNSLVKLANELRRARNESMPLVQQREFAHRSWYEGGMWRAPALLPGVVLQSTPPPQDQEEDDKTALLRMRYQPEALSLTALFFHLVTVTAFTRVGVAISQNGYMSWTSLAYYAIFWNVWSKESAYYTRFDTSDLSSQIVALLTCFAVLFASLSVQFEFGSPGGNGLESGSNRVMLMAAVMAGLQVLLHIRVAVTVRDMDIKFFIPNSSSAESTASTDAIVARIKRNVTNYAIVNIILNFLETLVWLSAIWLVPMFIQPLHTYIVNHFRHENSDNGDDDTTGATPQEETDQEKVQDALRYRWILFAMAMILAIRSPRGFLPSDFDTACSKRGVLFILLLGFLLQSMVVVASEFFEYQSPSLEDYAFLGAACLLLFCIKLLYVDHNADTLAQDHALLINRCSGLFFSLGHFILLLSTTVMGSGLNLITHSYLAATAALDGPGKTLVCGGFSAILASSVFIQSLHLKRVPADPRHRFLFVAAYVIQTAVQLLVIGLTAYLSLVASGANVNLLFLNPPVQFSVPVLVWMEWILESELSLMLVLAGAALFCVLICWLDEGVELLFYASVEDARALRIHPFGAFWCCGSCSSSLVGPASSSMTTNDDDDDDLDPEASAALDLSESSYNARNLSELSPLLGGSTVASMKAEMASSSVKGGYDAVATTED